MDSKKLINDLISDMMKKTKNLIINEMEENISNEIDKSFLNSNLDNVQSISQSSNEILETEIRALKPAIELSFEFLISNENSSYSNKHRMKRISEVFSNSFSQIFEFLKFKSSKIDKLKICFGLIEHLNKNNKFNPEIETLKILQMRFFKKFLNLTQCHFINIEDEDLVQLYINILNNFWTENDNYKISFETKNEQTFWPYVYFYLRSGKLDSLSEHIEMSKSDNFHVKNVIKILFLNSDEGNLEESLLYLDEHCDEEISSSDPFKSLMYFILSCGDLIDALLIKYQINYIFRSSEDFCWIYLVIKYILKRKKEILYNSDCCNKRPKIESDILTKKVVTLYKNSSIDTDNYVFTLFSHKFSKFLSELIKDGLVFTSFSTAFLLKFKNINFPIESDLKFHLKSFLESTVSLENYSYFNTKLIFCLISQFKDEFSLKEKTSWAANLLTYSNNEKRLKWLKGTNKKDTGHLKKIFNEQEINSALSLSASQAFENKDFESCALYYRFIQDKKSLTLLYIKYFVNKFEELKKESIELKGIESYSDELGTNSPLSAILSTLVKVKKFFLSFDSFFITSDKRKFELSFYSLKKLNELFPLNSKFKLIIENKLKNSADFLGLFETQYQIEKKILKSLIINGLKLIEFIADNFLHVSQFKINNTENEIITEQKIKTMSESLSEFSHQKLKLSAENYSKIDSLTHKIALL